MRISHRFFVSLVVLLLAANFMQAADVVGRVRDNLGQGISNLTVNASVFTSQSYTQMVSITDAAGSFSFAGDAGSWQVSVEPQGLFSGGYFEVAPRSIEVASNQTRGIRFTTRRLELIHRIAGRLTSDFELPLSGVSVLASIHENGLSFQTNVVTGSDGSFHLAVSPGIWRIVPQDFQWPSLYFAPVANIEIEEDRPETVAHLVAPFLSAMNLSVVASNLSGFQLVIRAEAHGQPYERAVTLSGSPATVSFPVFPGTWVVSVTNHGFGLANSFLPPPPATVSVTNSSVQVHLSGIIRVQHRLTVRALKPDGNPVTNASIYASGELGGFVSPPPLPGPVGQPGVAHLDLPEGKWRVTAAISSPDYVPRHQVTRVITITTNGSQTLDLIFPDEETSPRIFGTVRDGNGVGISGMFLDIVSNQDGTNHNGWVAVDSGGQFSTRVLPGVWMVQLQGAAPCAVYSGVVVSNSDVRVDLEYIRPQMSEVLVRVATLDEEPETAPNAQISLSSGISFWITNVIPGSSAEMYMHPGLWSATHGASWFNSDDGPYWLHPALRWHLLPVAETNLALIGRTASARIEGRIRDEQGGLLTTGYASARANIDGTNYTASSAVSSGYFSLNVIPGSWEVAASTWRYPSFDESLVAPSRPGEPPVVAHAEPPPQIIQVTGSVVRCEFVASHLPASSHLAVTVIREDGSPLENVYVSVRGSLPTGFALTDAAGGARFTVPPGEYSIQVDWNWAGFNSEQLFLPSLPVELTAPSNHFTLVARRSTTCISGTLTNANAASPLVSVIGSIRVQGTNYIAGACVERDGRFCIPAFPGAWDVTLADFWANSIGLQSSPPQVVIVPGTGEPSAVLLSVQPITGDFREARLSLSSIEPDGDVQLELRGQAALTWRIEQSIDLCDWTPVATVTSANGVAEIPVAMESPGSTAFFRAVWVK